MGYTLYSILPASGPCKSCTPDAGATTALTPPWVLSYRNPKKVGKGKKKF